LFIVSECVNNNLQLYLSKSIILDLNIYKRFILQFETWLFYIFFFGKCWLYYDHRLYFVEHIYFVNNLIRIIFYKFRLLKTVLDILVIVIYKTYFLVVFRYCRFSAYVYVLTTTNNSLNKIIFNKSKLYFTNLIYFDIKDRTFI